MKLYWRIPWLVALAFGFGLTMTIIVNLTALRRETEIFTTTVTEATLTQTVLVAQAIDREAKQRDWVQVQARLRRLNRQPLQAYYQVIAPDGRILADSRRIEPSGRLDSALSMQMLTGATLISADPELPHHIQVTILLPDQTGQSAAILRNVTNWESQFTAKQGQARISMVIALLTTIAITAGMLTLFWRLVVGPLETLRQLAEAVTQGEVAARAPSFHVVELQQVGAALNQMLARSATQQYELERVNRWLQTTNAALQAQTETVQTINYIGRLLSAETAQQKLTQSVIDATTELTGAEFGAFFYNVRNERGETHQHYTIAGASPAAIVSSPMSSNTALLAHTFQGREVIRLADVRQSPQYGHHAPYYGIPPGHVPVVSYLAAPIISRSDQIIGGLFLAIRKLVFLRNAPNKSWLGWLLRSPLPWTMPTYLRQRKAKSPNANRPRRSSRLHSPKKRRSSRKFTIGLKITYRSFPVYSTYSRGRSQSNQCLKFLKRASTASGRWPSFTRNCIRLPTWPRSILRTMSIA